MDHSPWFEGLSDQEILNRIHRERENSAKRIKREAEESAHWRKRNPKQAEWIDEILKGLPTVKG